MPKCCLPSRWTALVPCPTATIYLQHANIVMGDLAPLFGMIQEVTDILEVLAVMVDQGVVDGNGALVAVATIEFSVIVRIYITFSPEFIIKA